MHIWSRRNKLWYHYVHNINRVNDRIINSKDEKTSITMSIARLDGGTTESHGETRRQHLHLHLQLRSGRLRNGKRVVVHGKLHHLSNGCDFGFLERKNTIKSTWFLDSTPINTALTAQHSLFTSAERIGRAWLKNCKTFSSAGAESAVLSAHVSPFCYSLTVRLPRTHHLPHSLFFLPRHKNTLHNLDNTIIFKNTQYIMNNSRLSQSTSSAMKNHFGIAEGRTPVADLSILCCFETSRSVLLQNAPWLVLRFWAARYS